MILDTLQIADPQLVPSGRGPLRFCLQVARGPYRRWILAILAGEGLHAACGILLPFALSRIITRIGSSHGVRAALLPELRGPLLLFVSLCGAELLLGRWNSALQLRVAPRQRQFVARALFAYLHRHSHRFLSENFAGALAHRISETSHGVNQTLWALLTELCPIAIVLLIANGLLLGADLTLGAFTSLWTLLFITTSAWLSRRTQPLSFAASNARSHTVGMVVDSVANHAAVRLFARLDHEQERLDRAYAGELQTVLRANLAMERIRIFQFVAAAVLKAGTVALSVWLWSRDQISVGQFVMAVSLALMVIAEVRNLSRRFLELFEYLGNVDSGVREIFRPHELVDAPGALSRPIRSGAVEFDAVGFRYADGARVFRGLSVCIPAGQRVGLVGLSGSGKSTFVNLLLRLHDPQRGSIRIDGHDLRSLSQAALRSQLAIIPQDPALFHRTLRENIRYGRIEASDAEVELAARRAHAHDFITQLPGGYDSEVGERGVKLSGGQRQRIALARVILKDAPVMILDEATSSLDSITEHAIEQALREVMKDKTVIVVAHRLSTIAHLDRILVFAGGRIVEDGSHDALLARRGNYFQLWSQQSQGRFSDAEDGASLARAAAPHNHDAGHLRSTPSGLTSA